MEPSSHMEAAPGAANALAVRPFGGRESGQSARTAADCAVRIAGLTKTYRSNWSLKTTRGLESLNLEVQRGEVFGYLGPNGAGKTTTLKILTGLLKPTSGSAWLLGEPIENVSSRARLGFLPEQPYFYDYLNGVEYLEFVARLSGMPAQPALKAARRWLGRVGLGEREKLVLRKYSKGMLQRLGLAAALVHDPELIILDEPMSGLDPFGRRDVRDLILEQRERGVTVMFSSHILPDVETLCDRVAILLRGRLERVATVGELVEGGGARIEFRCAGEPLLELPVAWRECLTRAQRTGETFFTLTDASQQQAVLGWLVARGVEVRAVTPQRNTLEELFMAAAESSAIQASRERRSA
ncbi:MAG: ABC transporter ATP-binding protein [Candidatus Eisenbacteria bacterium]|nr:ABC transporter ATP-binding protein [Candidatus Eisenbacteria bacterium]